VKVRSEKEKEKLGYRNRRLGRFEARPKKVDSYLFLAMLPIPKRLI